MTVVLLSSSSEKLLNMQLSDNLQFGLYAYYLQRERKAAAKMGVAIAWVPYFVDTFMQGGSSVLRESIPKSVSV